jgi:broad specificity phosphatase PhoE
MHIYVLRHGQTDRNAHGYSNVYDISLNKFGKEQAARLEGYYDVVICSNLRRAKQTLEHSKIKYGRIQPSELCREQRLEISDLLEGETLGAPETSDHLKQRANKFKDLLRLYPKTKKILVISHHHFLMELTGHELKNGELRGWDPLNPLP